MLYKIRFGNGNYEIVASDHSTVQIIFIFNDAKIYFKLYDVSYVKPEYLGLSYESFPYWLPETAKFPN